MPMEKIFFITTAIDYVNDKPHIGHAYEKIIADSIARAFRFLGKKVYFLTGTDEHGLKIERTAREKKKEIKELVEENAMHFKNAWDSLGISYDRFIRTSEDFHKKIVQDILQRVYDKGYIYKGMYEGYYCIGCEKYLSERELVNGKCPLHPNKEIEKLEMESYFFRLSAFEDKVLNFLENTEFLSDKFKKEIINRIKSQGLKDISISRPKSYLSWGIELPFDETHVTYVWFDALVNYITGAKEKGFEEVWPPDIQIIGKDILWFHSVIWPSILLASNLELPKKLLVHGHLTVNKQKISKSLGNVIDPLELLEKFPSDSLRWYLLRRVPLEEDSDFSIEELRRVHNHELANELGNLVQRCVVMIHKYFGSTIPEGKKEGKLKEAFDDFLAGVKKNIEKLNFGEVCRDIFNLIKETNAYLNEKEPWRREENRKDTIFNCAEACYLIACYSQFVLPETSKKIVSLLNQKLKNLLEIKEFGKNLETGKEIKKAEILFKKV